MTPQTPEAIRERLDEKKLAAVLLWVSARAGLQGRDFSAHEAARALRAFILDEPEVRGEDARNGAPMGGQRRG